MAQVFDSDGQLVVPPTRTRHHTLRECYQTRCFRLAYARRHLQRAEEIGDRHWLDYEAHLNTALVIFWSAQEGVLKPEDVHLEAARTALDPVRQHLCHVLDHVVREQDYSEVETPGLRSLMAVHNNLYWPAPVNKRQPIAMTDGATSASDTRIPTMLHVLIDGWDEHLDSLIRDVTPPDKDCDLH